MSTFRVLVEVTTDDLDGINGVFADMASLIESDLAGTVAWQTFVDEKNGTAVVYEEFVDEEAAITYEELMEESGLADRARALFTGGRLLLLAEPATTMWKGYAAEPTTDVFAPNAGFRRPNGSRT